ncbi:hypothetical protein MSG28_001930, partial [Choristoneura fumiferana]
EGYWGLRKGGCRRCECGAGAAACDPVTGQCACAPGVGGDACDRCLRGFYGFGAHGCLHTCDPLTGECKCRAGWGGARCAACAAGHYGPRCKPCACDAHGTAGCEDGVCPCDNHGRCSCKVDQDSLIAIHTHSLDSTISLPWPPVPVYMELDKRFLGDRVTSYGGMLRFRVEEEGGESLGGDTLARFPLVRILLNVSLDTAIPGFSRSEPALGVELCSCPAGYSAPSCHEPAVGFWMPPTKVHLDSVSGTIVIRLEGEAQPCNCNGRATSCDPDTGHCLSCAAAYYRGADGACVACACDAAGALSPLCDARGRCRCREFATGAKCDQCKEPRLWMDGGGCRACDNCTLTLLDSIEHLTSELNSRADLTELSRIPQPYPALREFAHNTSLLHNTLRHLTKDLEHSRRLEQELSNLEAKEHNVFTQVYSLKEDALRKEEMAKFLSLESMSWLEEALKQRQRLGEQVAILDDFARGEKHLGAHKAIKEARHLLRNIKDVKLVDFISSANDVHDAANVQSTAIQELNYSVDDAYRRLRNLQASAESWHERAEDLPKLADVVWSVGDRVAALERDARPRMAAARDVGLRCRLVLEDVQTLSNNTLTEDATAAILHSETLALSLPALTAELEALTLAAEEKEGILYNLTPAYKEKFLNPVERHVQELGVKAREYKSLFAGTRALASAGVTAARAWSEVADTVRNASANAYAAATAASTAAEMGPMMSTADKAKEASEELKKRGTVVMNKAEELRRQLEHLRRGADSVSVVLRGLGWQERDLGVRPSARVAQTIVSQIRGNMLRGAETAEALAAAAAARARDHETASNAMRPSLSALADKIARAKHAADSYGGARLEIAARGRHCHGRPVHVQAARVFASNKLEKGSLRVNGEETLGSPSPPVQSAAALPDLSATTYWVGGAPPGQEAPAPPLLGCLGALSVDREGYDVLDTPTRHGVEARCMARTLRTATLEGTGYIELPCPIFRRKAALGLTFRAASPNGLLLYRTPSTLSENEVDDEDGDDKHYLKLVMVEGEMLSSLAAVTSSFIFHGGSLATHWLLYRIPSSFSTSNFRVLLSTMSSGLGTKTKPKHYLALVVREGRLRLSVRGRRRKEVALPAPQADGDDVVMCTALQVSIRLSRNRLVLSAGGAAAAAHAPVAQRASRLFVGGVPQPPQLPHIPNSILRVGGFLGCVRRVEVNGRAQDLVRTAAAHHRVGQCFPNVEQAAYFGAVARAETRGPGNKALCDNAWHTVVARVSRAHVSLSLDAGPEIRSSGDATLVDDAETPEALTALYIGGLP